MRAIRRVLTRHRDLRLLVLAGLTSLIGDWAMRVGVTYYVYDLTGSTLASAAMLLASFLPSVFLGSLAGVFVDRWNRVTTMIAANLLQALALTPLLAVHGADDVWLVYAVTVSEAVVALFFVPAEHAMLPRVVPDADLSPANAVNGQVRELARLIGPAVGGAVVAAGGITGLAAVNAATFVLSAVLIARIGASGRVHPPAGAAESRHSGAPRRRRVAELAHEWLAGLRLARASPQLRAVFVYSLIAMTGEGVLGTLFAPFVRDVLHGDGRTFGVILSAQAVGGIVGGVLAAGIAERVSLARMLGFGAIALGVVDMVMFLCPLVYAAPWPAVVCMALAGGPGAVAMVGYNTLLQRGAPDAFRGRVLGALGVVQGTGILVGTAVAGIVGGRLDTIAVLAVESTMPVIGGLAVLAILGAAASATGPRRRPRAARTPPGARG